MRLLALFSVSVLVLAACGDDDGGSASTPDSVVGTWHVDTIGDAAVTGDVVLTAGFAADGSLSGDGGCNRYMGTYETVGSSIAISALASTLALCPSPELEAQERALLAALEGAEEFAIDGEQLTLSDAAGLALVELTAFDPTLEGTAWQAISYNNGREAVVSVINGSEITAEFGADGTLTGNAGCNEYSGDFETDGSSISIDPPTRTEIACLEPAGVMEQENEYLAALETASTWSIDGVSLDLRTADGARAASFAPAPG